MDDLDKAIVCSYEAGGSIDPVLRSQATAYCQWMKDEAPSICRLCVERLSTTELVPVMFWCLQTIHDTIRHRYSSIDPSELAFLRESLISIGFSGGAAAARVCGGPAFVKNKFAQTVVALVYFEYPSVWSTPFTDILQHLDKGPAVIDMFSRVLVSLDDELISMEYPRSAEDIKVGGRVKDAMRMQCVPQFASAWYNILSVYKTSDPELASLVLDSMRRCISWIDIGLIANEVFASLLFEIILSGSFLEQLRASAASCVGAIVLKRMEPHQKILLLQSLRVGRVFCMVAGGGDSELVSKISNLIISYAAEALECAKVLCSTGGNGIGLELLEEALPSVFFVMQNCEVESVVNALQFLSDYVSRMKAPTPKQVFHIERILEVIKGRISYDPMYRDNLRLPDKIGREEEDQMTEHRKDFFPLLRSISRVAPDVTQLFIRTLLTNALNSSVVDVEEVEVTLSLFYRIGETISDDGMRCGSGQLKELIPMLLSARFVCHSHRIVALIHLETVTRYLKFVQDNTQYIPHLLSVFLDDRGIHHANPNVRRRASYLFMRAVKLLRTRLLPFTDMILQNLHEMVARFTSLDWFSIELKSSSTEDGSHIFEAIGLLIGTEDISLGKQSEYLSALLTPLCHQVKSLLLENNLPYLEESSSKVASIKKIVMAINALSKGFSERLLTGSRPEIGIMFKQTLDVLLQALAVFPDMDPLRDKITSFLHRMVEILGASTFPYLPMALEKLLAKSEPKNLVDILGLMNQLIYKFNTSIHGILEEIFPAVASKLFHIFSKDAFFSGPDSNAEETRELQELQRTLCTFLHVLITHDLSSVLLTPKGRQHLSMIMQMVLFTSCNHKDIVVRKVCVQIIVRLIKDWSVKHTEEEKVPGFQSFIIETFATHCCLFSVLDCSFNFRDANTLVLFGEIMMAQKVMYEKFGNDFLIHFVSKGLSAAHCPQELAEQYYQKLQSDDIKSLRTFYQSLVENLRRGQNGSLVFR